MGQKPKRASGRKSGERIEPHFGKPKSSRGPRRPAKATSARKPGPSLLKRGLYLIGAAAIWGTLGLGGASVYFTQNMPDPVLATIGDRSPTVSIRAGDGTVLAERGLRLGQVSTKELPPFLVEAVLSTEDRRFYRHFGIDPLGLMRATFANLRSGAVVEGGSTITQQLAKNLFLKPDRTMGRKLKEIVYALWLEQHFGKDEILELYLNRVYFGGGAYGVEAAARHYFGKSARQVTLPEAALLAGLLKAPSKYAPTRSPTLAQARAEVVLANMVEAGALKSSEAAAAERAPARLNLPDADAGFEYAVDWIVELLPEFTGDARGDLIVETTLDARIQRAAQAAVRDALDRDGARLGASEGSAVVMDPEGEIKAIVGGRSYRDSPFNRAIKALRQPGSAFKPFVYLAAMEHGYTPDTLASDAPIKIKGWAPRNYKDEYRGMMSLRDSYAQSINTVAVRLLMDVGRGRVVSTARRLGIASPLHSNPSIALGTAEVTLLELTSAYAPFANGGEGVFPHVITRVRTPDGTILYRRRGTSRGQVVAGAAVGKMNDLMRATLISGTGKQAAIALHPAGGKTGTSQDFRDAWFVGFTGYYVGGVWIGNDNGKPMRKATGGGLPASIWHEIMTAAHDGKPPRALPGTERGGLMAAIAPRTTEPGGDDAPRGFLQRVFGSIAGGG